MAAMLCGVPGITTAQGFQSFTVEHSGGTQDEFSLVDFNRITFQSTSTITLSGNNPHSRDIEYLSGRPLRITFKKELSKACLPVSDNGIILKYQGATRTVFVSIPENSLPDNTVLNIFTSTGISVMTLRLHEQTNNISVEHLPAGIYLASVYSSDGNFISLKFKI